MDIQSAINKSIEVRAMIEGALKVVASYPIDCERLKKRLNYCKKKLNEILCDLIVLYEKENIRGLIKKEIALTIDYFYKEADSYIQKRWQQ